MAPDGCDNRFNSFILDLVFTNVEGFYSLVPFRSFDGLCDDIAAVLLALEVTVAQVH